MDMRGSDIQPHLSVLSVAALFRYVLVLICGLPGGFPNRLPVPLQCCNARASDATTTTTTTTSTATTTAAIETATATRHHHSRRRGGGAGEGPVGLAPPTPLSHVLAVLYGMV